LKKKIEKKLKKKNAWMMYIYIYKQYKHIFKMSVEKSNYLEALEKGEKNENNEKDKICEINKIFEWEKFQSLKTFEEQKTYIDDIDLECEDKDGNKPIHLIYEFSTPEMLEYTASKMLKCIYNGGMSSMHHFTDIIRKNKNLTDEMMGQIDTFIYKRLIFGQ